MFRILILKVLKYDNNYQNKNLKFKKKITFMYIYINQKHISTM